MELKQSYNKADITYDITLCSVSSISTHGFINNRDVIAQLDDANPIYISGWNLIEFHIQYAIFFIRLFKEFNVEGFFGRLFLIVCLMS